MRFFNWDSDPAVLCDDGAFFVGRMDGSVSEGANVSAMLRDERAPEISEAYFRERFPKRSAAILAKAQKRRARHTYSL